MLRLLVLFLLFSLCIATAKNRTADQHFSLNQPSRQEAGRDLEAADQTQQTALDINAWTKAQGSYANKTFLLYGLLSVAVITVLVFIACYAKDCLKRRHRTQLNGVTEVERLTTTYHNDKRFSLVKQLSFVLKRNEDVERQIVVACPLHEGHYHKKPQQQQRERKISLHV